MYQVNVIREFLLSFPKDDGRSSRPTQARHSEDSIWEHEADRAERIRQYRAHLHEIALAGMIRW